jgi:23S rRNA U2552 (ribose-2'-O)-methylase RlmE/FtsJ
MTQQSRDRDKVLGLYLKGPTLLEEAISGLNDSELDLSLAPGTWSIRQYVHHVVDGDDIWRTALRAALGQIQRVIDFQWYWDFPQDTWAERWGYAGRALDPPLALLHAGRRYVVVLLRNIPGAWERSVTMRWPDGREQTITVCDTVEVQADHVLGHIRDIQAIRKEHGL